MLVRSLIRYGIIVVIIVLFGLFAYPTLYKYDKLDQKYPVRINRITGKTEVLTLRGWIEMKNYSITQNNQQEPTQASSVTKTNMENAASKIERHTLKSDLFDINTNEIEIGEITKISKIHFNEYYVTGEVTNISNEKIEVMSIGLEVFDKNENIIANQPDHKSLITILNPGESKIFQINLKQNSKTIGKFRIEVKILTGL